MRTPLKTVIPVLFICLITMMASLAFAAPVLEGADTAKGNRIHLKAATFIPKLEAPVIPVDLAVSPQETQYFIVQLKGPVHKKTLDALTSRGVKLLDYVPDFAYIARIQPSRVGRIERLSIVNWVGPYHPGYKLAADLHGESGMLRVNVKVFDEADNMTIVGEAIEQMGGEIVDTDIATDVLQVRIDASLIDHLAFLPEVQWMDRHAEKEHCMDNIRILSGAGDVHVGGYDGSGIVGEVSENGYDRDHYEFTGQILAEDGNVQDNEAHGTCTFGIIFARGQTSKAKGMLPGAQGVFCDWDISRYTSIDNLYNNWGGLFQSNSWMITAYYGDYTTYSQQNDQAIYDHDLVSMLYAAGNYGYDIATDGVSKNVICVGALNHYDNLNWNDDAHTSAHHGPAADGRIKPDLCAAYDWIYTADVLGSGGYSYGDYYSDFGGTSGATPITAGAAGLVYEMYRDNHFGNNPGGSLPHAATVKAMLINHARQYSFSQATRYEQGWGYPEVDAVYDNPDDFIVDEDDTIGTGQSRTWNFGASSGTPFKATLVWTDYPGVTSSSKHLVNDLSLKVTGPYGTVYRGNYGLTSSQWSSPGGSEDHTNNVENVFIQSPENGQYAVEVFGYNVVQPTGNPLQDFALVVSGITFGNQPPNVPSNPGPADGATNVGIDQDLAWDGGDPNPGDLVYYDVYFGASPTPGFMERIGPYPASQTSTSYDPGTLNYNTQYYWKIVAEDDQLAMTEGPVWNFTTMELNEPPYTPVNPDPADGSVDIDTGADLSWDGGDPNAADAVYYEVYFGETTPPPYYDTTENYPATQASITFDPGAMSTNTTYYWQIIAYDSQGESATGAVWTFTTTESQPIKFHATTDIPVANGGISGNYSFTHASDDGYEGITERQSGGKPSHRHSFLEHKWTLSVGAGYSTYMFYIEAFHSANSEGDDFVFAYSTDNVNYTDMVTVTKTADDDLNQSFPLPTSLSGTVYIRVKDTDRTSGRRNLDTIYIDQMYIEAGGSPPPNDPPYSPANPSPTNGAVDVDVNANLGWDGGDPNSIDMVYYEVFLGETSPPPYYGATGAYPATQTAITYDPGSLSSNATYYWQIVSYDNLGEYTAGPEWMFSTGDTPTTFHAKMDIPVKNGGLIGDYVDTQASDDVYEGIIERDSGGKPANRYSYLEHKWTIDVAGGSGTYTYYIEAYHTSNSEGDDFVFAYSTNDAGYTDMVTVAKTADDGAYQTFTIPEALSGTVYIRVKDTNRTAGNRTKDTIYIDHMFIGAN